MRLLNLFVLTLISLNAFTSTASAADSGDTSDQEKNISLVIVIDRSYSTKGRIIEYAKQAAIDALEQLSSSDEFSVVAFDSQPYVPVPTHKPKNKLPAIEAISKIQASGQTNMYPALGIAYRLLRDSPLARRHVILLSDGDTAPAEYEGLVKRMVENGITVSTVTIPANAVTTQENVNPNLMRKLAKWGLGRNQIALDGSMIPTLVREETKRLLDHRMMDPAREDQPCKESRYYYSTDFSVWKYAEKVNGDVIKKLMETTLDCGGNTRDSIVGLDIDRDGSDEYWWTYGDAGSAGRPQAVFIRPNPTSPYKVIELGFARSVVYNPEKKYVIVELHGTACDGVGADFCEKKITFSNGEIEGMTELSEISTDRICSRYNAPIDVHPERCESEK